MSAEPLDVVLCWHMHQPQYRDAITHEYRLPWTYLHAIKDYTDMAAHLEANPGAKAVVNFVPILLDQIADYTTQINAYQQQQQPLRDPLLQALVSDVVATDTDRQFSLIKACLRANQERQITPYPDFAQLVEHAKWLIEHPFAIRHVNAQFLADLVVWYHLAWLGYSVRCSSATIKQLIDKARGFTLQDRRALLAVIGKSIATIIPRYRLLAERQQVELSLTPYAHPILPLLLDFSVAKESMPEVTLPTTPAYPHGYARARWHIEQGFRSFTTHFGMRPAGCWPAEGAVSDATLRLLNEYDIRWVASGQAVLRNSLDFDGITRANPHYCIHRAYQLQGTQTKCFFRDDGLSDFIGFQYATWHADDAVANLLHHLENIAANCADTPGSIVSIIMDGENAWEYYPENGFYFLNALYQKLSAHPKLRLTTYTEHLQRTTTSQNLSHLVAGSWVYGTLSTWIGDKDKNHAWEMLVEAKLQFDEVVAAHCLTAQQLKLAEQQLAICEGSDWFWWLGDYNPESTVSDFEQLFRQNLSNLYTCLQLVPPSYLSDTFAHGSGSPAQGGVMRRGTPTT